MKNVKDYLDFQLKLNNESAYSRIEVKNLSIWSHPGSYWEPSEYEVEADSILINGVEIDWENDKLVDLILDKAEELFSEELYLEEPEECEEELIC